MINIMKKLLILLIFIIAGLKLYSKDFVAPLHPVAKYGIASWTEKGRGNHRALVAINAPVKGVRVKIPWRRRDANPGKKKIVVFAPDGKNGNHKRQTARGKQYVGRYCF